MNALPAYERDPQLRTLDTEVLACGDDGRPYALLADTILYPEGGGQPADHGRLGGARVLDVQKREGEVRHYLDAPVPAGPARLELDWERRWDHMQQHTGQHLLTAVADTRFGWATLAFHLGAEVSDIELEVPGLSPRDLASLEEAVAAEIRAARPVRGRRVAPEAMAALGVRSRGLPEGFTGDVRLVEIEGVDLNTCGGTHVATTADLESIKLLGTESLRGGTRLFFVVGARLRKRLEAHEKRNAALRGLLGAPDEALAGSLEGKLEQLRQAERKAKGLEEELAGLVVESLAAREGRLAEHHFEGRDAGFLQKAARRLMEAAPAKGIFLTATSGGQHFFVLAAGSASTLDVAGVGRQVAELLEGRGGGSAGFFQGKAGSLARRQQAVEML